MKSSNFKLFFILVFFYTLACQTRDSNLDPNPGSWTAVSSADGSEPVARHEAAFVAVGDRFYLVGGRGAKPVNIYDPNTNKWSLGDVPPLEMHHLQPVEYEGKIFVLGALTGGYPGETPIDNIYIYDPQSNQWSKGDSIPADRLRGAAGAALYKGKIYMACGIKDGHRGDHKKWLDVYDPKTGQWNQLPDAPRPRDHFQAIVAADKLYLMGGRTTKAAEGPFKNTMHEVDVFDFKTQKWSTLSQGLPTDRAGNYAVLFGNEIIVMGGESQNQKAAHAETEALNIQDNSWRNLGLMINGRHGTGAILYKDKIYVASGSGDRGGGPELTTMEAFGF